MAAVEKNKSKRKIPDVECSKPHKRNKAPEVRVSGGRIYDSVNGKTCHQCRQKTLDFSADCKNNVTGKPCTLKFCHTCLMNRYGEKAEDVASLEDWSCPRKKRGHKPTGALVQIAKAGGFSSVSDLLHVKGAQNVGHDKNPEQTDGALSRKQTVPEVVNMVTSPKKSGKENTSDGKTELNVIPSASVQNHVKEKPKNTKRKALKVIHDCNGVREPSKGYIKKAVSYEKVDYVHQDKKISKDDIHKEEAETMNNACKGNETFGIKGDQNTKPFVNTTYHNVKNSGYNLDDKYSELVVPLPTGTELVTIGGVDIPKKDAGNALQFLEFCAAFGKILNVRKGQAEVVLRELVKGRSARRGKCSMIIQFHVQLLSVIQEDIGSECPTFDATHGSDTWLKALKICIPNSKHMRETLDFIDKKAGGYDHLDLSMKLRLLNFLCDEVLGTEKIRNWIDDQNTKLSEQRKEAKERFAAAKDKEKCLKQKLHDDIAKALIARNGVPLTIQEHESVVSEIKKKSAQAHTEMLECKRMVPIDKERPDAVRTEPIFMDNKGHAYWRLKGYSDKSEILLQDIGSKEDIFESSESWFKFDADQMTVIDKHIKALRNGRFRP